MRGDPSWCSETIPLTDPFGITGVTIKGIVSLHQLGSPRIWTMEEIAECQATATRVGELL